MYEDNRQYKVPSDSELKPSIYLSYARLNFSTLLDRGRKQNTVQSVTDKKMFVCLRPKER